MSAENCRIQYEQAKRLGNIEKMAYWKARGEMKGVVFDNNKEEEPEEIVKEKPEKKAK